MENQKNNAASKVWFITGASRGFVRIWTEAALERGDKVAATARNLDSIADLEEKYPDRVLTLELDVIDSDQVETTVKQAYQHFGKLDIVLNNAGYSLVSTIEEASKDEIKMLYDTNILGAVSVIQAAIPLLRKQGYGHILGTSSNLGHISNPLIGYYCSSKWAFEAIYESLAMEIEQFGIDVTIIEPGAYDTDFGSKQSLKFAEQIAVYDEMKSKIMKGLQSMEKGDPNATPQAIFKVVDAKKPPRRLFLGANNLAQVKEVYSKRLQEWEEWNHVAKAAQSVN